MIEESHLLRFEYVRSISRPLRWAIALLAALGCLVSTTAQAQVTVELRWSRLGALNVNVRQGDSISVSAIVSGLPGSKTIVFLDNGAPVHQETTTKDIASTTLKFGSQGTHNVQVDVLDSLDRPRVSSTVPFNVGPPGASPPPPTKPKPPKPSRPLSAAITLISNPTGSDTFTEVGRSYEVHYTAEGGIPPYTPEWTTPRGSGIRTPFLKGGATARGAIPLTLKVTDSTGASVTTAKTVQVVQPLALRVTGPAQVASDQTVSYTATPQGGVGPYRVVWTTGKGAGREGVTLTGKFHNPGQIHINVSLTDQGLHRTHRVTRDFNVTVAGGTTAPTTPATSGVGGWWLWVETVKVDDKPVIKLHPVYINNTLDAGGTFNGVYFPYLNMDNLIQTPDQSPSHIHLKGSGGSYSYTWDYPNGTTGTGTMNFGGAAANGSWQDNGGHSGSWKWRRPSGTELNALVQHFGRR